MPFQLRAGNTGIPLVPTVDAVTLVWDLATASWDFGPAGASIDPLLAVRYVDQNTAVPLADQDGSIAAPFTTMQAGLDALALIAPTRCVLLVCPGDYSAESLSFLAEKDLQVTAVANPGRGFNAEFTDATKMGDIVTDFGCSITGMQHRSVDGGLGNVTLLNTSLNGPRVLTSNGGLVLAFNTFVGGIGNQMNAANVRLRSCQLQDIDMSVSGTLVEVTASEWAIGAGVVFAGAPGSLRLDSMTNRYWTDMGGAATVTNGAVVVLV